MKALDYLTKRKDILEKRIFATDEITDEAIEIDESIYELIAFMKPKSCETCKHYDGSHACLKWNSIAYKSELRVYPEDGCLQEYSPKETL